MRVAAFLLVLPCLSVACFSDPPSLPGLTTDSGSSDTTGPSPATGPSPTTSGPVEDTGIDTGVGGCSNDADCDDDNPCSIDGCNVGTCEHQPNPDDPTCSCETPADCTQLPPDDDCRTRACTDNVCSLELAEAGTELNDTQQTMEDCQILVCDGSGGSVSISDDTDIPVDGLECTADECVAGVPSNPPLPAGTGCAAGECDDTGQCEGCTGPEDCGGISSFCQMVTCDSGVCGLALTPAGTDVPDAGALGDCQVVQCDGRGNEVSVADDNDFPADDGNGCTAEVCTSGVASHPAAVGQACNDALFCTATDTCNAAAACVGVGNPCPGADGDGNCAETCNEAADACTASDPNGSACNDGLYCNGTDSCSSGACSGHTGSPCPGADGDSNCAETCNETSDVCTAADPNGSACNDGLYCNGTDTCSGGACSGHTGSPCPGPDGDSNCAETCNEAADACTTSDPNGSACDDGQFCNGTDSCSGGACSGHTGSPCPGADGDSNCSETCNEAADACTGADPNGSACNDALYCNGTDTCGGGTCSVHLGSPCPGADGDSNCAETCNEAADACTSPDANGSACNDGTYCNGADTCNGGACSVHVGSPCPGPDGDVDCSETCNEAADACTSNDPNGNECGECGVCSSGNCANQCFGTCCEPGMCVGMGLLCP